MADTTTSIVDLLEQNALAAVQGKGAEWAQSFVDRAQQAIASIPETNPELAAVKNGLSYGLAKFAKNQDAYAQLGLQRTIALMTRLAVGQTSAAAEILVAYGGGRGGWGKADDTVAASSDKTINAKIARDEAVRIAEDTGAFAAKSLLPVLLSVGAAAV